MPRVTITHLGTVDIAVTDLASQGNKLRTEYPKMVFNFLEHWVKSARKVFRGKHRQLRMFDEKIKHHKWLLVSVSEWGRSDKIRGVTWEQHRINKSLANTGMENN